MELWQIFSIVGLSFVILEMFTPSMFFLNFGIAAFITAGISLWLTNLTALIIIFVALSLVLLLFLRPLLMKKNLNVKKADDAYIGKIAKVTKNVSSADGTISIYDERWDARSLNGELIEEGAEVRIVKNESIIMFVERI